MERIQRWREPAVVVVAAALLVRLVLVVVFASTAARSGLSSQAEALYLANRQLSEPTLFVVLAALVACCWLAPPTEHARTLTTAALAVAGVSALLAVVLAFAGYRGYTAPFSQLDFIDRLVGLVVPVVAVALLVLLRQGRSAPAGAATRGAAVEGATPTALPAAPVAATELEPRPDPELAPTWQPDEASGASWHTAGDAASGRPASTWGTPGVTGGWLPAEQPPAAGRPDPGDHFPDGAPRQPEPGEHPWGTGRS